MRLTWVQPEDLLLQEFVQARTEGLDPSEHEERWLAAAGGSLALRLGFWLLPITVQYQLARRFTDDQALVHLIQLGL